MGVGSITYTVLVSGNLRWSNEKTRACARIIEKLRSTEETGESSFMPADFNCGGASLDNRQLPYRRRLVYRPTSRGSVLYGQRRRVRWARG